MRSQIPDPYIPLKQATQILGVAEGTLRAMADRGEVQYMRDSNGQRRFLLSSVMSIKVKKDRELARSARERARHNAKQARKAGS